MKKAAIMAGGFGTRLRPLTMTIPKPMVPILNTPMMEHIVNLLKKFGIKDILSILYFQPDTITSHFEDGSKYGINMSYQMANADYGTAGAVKNAQKHIAERFIVISGDVLTDFDLAQALEFHIKKKSLATILLTRVTKPLQYGIVMTDKNGKINRFLEKPSWGEVFSDTINTGIYILEPEVLDLIPYQEEFDFSKDLFPLMLRQKLPLYGYITEGYWRDIGNLDEYQMGQIDAINKKVDLTIKGIQNDNYNIGTNSKIAPTAKLSGLVVIGNNSNIGEHTQIYNSIIGNNVTIGAGVRLSGVTIWDNTIIEDFAELTDDVICKDCIIGSSSTISENVFISDRCKIGVNSFLAPNIKLWPDKIVEEGATLTYSLVQEEKWFRELFTGGRVSGISNLEIHPEFGSKLGAALGMSFGPNTSFLASRDYDKVSRIMKRALEAGLASVGVNVNDLQVTSIPQTRQEIRTGKYSGGFHVRRSPRHPNKTDIIIFNEEGRDISTSRTKTVERYFFGEDTKRVNFDKVGSIYFPERTNEIYINRYLNSIDTKKIRDRKFKLLIDYSFGLAANIFPKILGKLHTDAISLNGYVDASRFNPDPSDNKQDNDEVARIMRSLGYELGFRLESGAEKISLIDERGAWFSPMRLLTIITKLFLESNKHLEPYKIAVSIVASSEIDKIAKDYNVEVLRIKNSHYAMMEATRDPKILFIGGIWGGYIFSDFLFASDGMYSIGKILEMLAITNYKISQLDEMLPRSYQYTIDAPCPKEFKGTVMRRAMEYSVQFKRELVEGVKIFHDYDSILIIPELEFDAFQIISESDQYDTAVTNAKKYSALVSQWRDEV